MSARIYFGRWLTLIGRLWPEDRASQVLEFALSLPLLVLFVVGIFDFSNAVSVKQKLTNAAREAARVAAADPANDLGTPHPASVSDAFWVVEDYFTSEKMNDCDLTGSPPALTTGFTYVSTATGGIPPCGAAPGLTLTINRGCKTQTTLNGATANLIETCVTIQYPYTWVFGHVSGFFGGSRFLGPTSITTTATAYNEN